MPVEIIRPSAVLAPFITEMRIITPAAGDVLQRVERLPDGTSSLIVRHNRAAVADVCIAGARRRALFKEVRPAPLSVVIQFTPGGAAPFVGLPASELTDRVVRLDDVWGAEAMPLREQLSSARDPHDILDLLQQALQARTRSGAFAASASPSACLARRAVQLLRDRYREQDAPMRVRDVAAALGVSDRHLRRAFEATVGVSPKEFARMLRLQRAMRAAARPRAHASHWTDIAAQAGYYDQAHMIAEFHELIGATPTAFMKHGVDRALRWASPECRAL
jgi:AraC-like DNA-binding protein